MTRPLRIATIGCALTLAALPAGARASVVNALDILPPGQSGFVSLAGVPTGQGSPHLYDQQPLFMRFEYKQHTFGQPGTANEPRPGIRIVRDKFGVPAITALSENDAWWGAGYAVAEDRLFELELFKRATSGRLAEILGQSYLDDDLIARRDYYTDAEVSRFLAQAPPFFQTRAAAYRDGINAYVDEIRNDPERIPGEFTALNVPLTRWTVEDTGRVGIFLARTVPSGDGAELRNLETIKAIGAKAFDTLLPLRVARRVATIPAESKRLVFPSQPGRTVKQERAAFARTQTVLDSMPVPSPEAQAGARSSVAAGLIGGLGGSSMFAVRRKSDKHAFLFNGPQLGFAVPELFVELEVNAPGYNVRGVTAPGVPLIGIGHNGNIAWGFTSGLSDEDDLYAEKLVPGQPERYEFKGEQRAMDCRDEVFRYQAPPTNTLSLTGGKVPDLASGSKTERICRTVHGPVQVRIGNVAYARRYAIFNRELETLTGIDALNRAKTIKEVDAAMQQVTWNENVMAADSQGNIGFWHPGLHPLRPLGYDERLPYPGTGEAEWRGLLDPRRTPHVINPKRGWLANWNNVPSEGWTSGDGEAQERQTGPYHRNAWLTRLVGHLAKNPTFEGSLAAIRGAGTTAQQRPLFSARLRKGLRGASGKAKSLLDALSAWDGSYDRTDATGTVDPGVAIWEQFKEDAARRAIDRLGGFDKAKELSGTPGSSHAFDMTLGEAYAMRTMTPAETRAVAEVSFDKLAATFKTDDVTRWREKRRLYKVGAQGAGSAPELPFFDRGTWEQFVELGP